MKRIVADLVSVADMVAMMVGFWIARKAPVWVSVVLFMAVEPRWRGRFATT